MDIYSYALLIKKIKEVAEHAEGGLVQVDTYSNLPSTGETNKIYCTQDTNKLYRWEDEYIEITSGGSTGGDAEGIIPITEAPTTDNPDDDLKIVILDKAPETEYSGYLYLITDDLFEFKVTDYSWTTQPTYTFLAEKGMTWEEWVNSDYNCFYDEQGEIIPNFWQYDSEYSSVYHPYGTGSGITAYLTNNIFKIYSDPDIDKNTHVQDGITYHAWTEVLH